MRHPKRHRSSRRPSWVPQLLVLEDRCLLSYTLTELPFFSAYGLNEAGQVAGVEGTSDGEHAFLWDSGVLTDLGRGRAFAINQATQVVGYSYVPSPFRHAVLWQDGVMTDLGTLGGVVSGAYGINNVGQVVGMAEPPQGSAHAFLWQNGVMTDLGTLDGNGSKANAINDAGQVVGAGTVGPLQHAFFWENGVMTDVGALGDWDNSEATAINNAGHFVGWSTNSDFDGSEFQPFFSDGGPLTAIGPKDSAAFGINDADQVVGYMPGAGPFNIRHHAFLYADGVLTDLNTLIPPDSGFILEEAHGITNDGLITGIGFDQVLNQFGSFLLTPDQGGAPQHPAPHVFQVLASMLEATPIEEISSQSIVTALGGQAPSATVATPPDDAMPRQVTDAVFASHHQARSPEPWIDGEVESLELGLGPLALRI